LSRIVHISDLHFGRTDEAVVEALVADINRQPPDLVAVSGDLTLRARRTEFREARAFLDRLAAPFLAVPGNHDISPYKLVERFAFPYRRWKTFVSPQIEPVWRDERTVVIGLNTARRMGLHWNWSHGRVNRRQIERIGRQIAALPDSLLRIVVAHHPFMPPEQAADTRLVGRARKAISAFSRYGVDLILAGHLHRGYRRALKRDESPDAPSPAPGAHSALHVIHASTATSTRLRDEPNAYNVIEVTGGGVALEVRTWDGVQWTGQGAAPI
jgi:3',5'-cyclic AMP phosphodiesterase CpdA